MQQAMDGWTTVAAADGQRLPLWSCQPRHGAHGVLVILPEIFGVNTHLRSVAQRWANAGYVTLVPDTFARVRAGVAMDEYTPAEVRRGMALKRSVERLPAPGVPQDLEATVEAARQLRLGSVAMLGFCWGGLLAWRAASQIGGLAAVVTYYGGGMTRDPEIKRQPIVPVLAHFARHDRHIPQTSVARFRAQHPNVQVQLHDAEHGFNCDLRASWNAHAAHQARQQTAQFLRLHLQPPT